MLRSIVINNFQSHKRTTIKLTEGVNVLVGKSQAGKTAVLRALRWALKNRPSGKRHIRHGEKTTSVIVRTMEGDKVVLRQDSSGKTYKVNDEVFRKFGAAVPEEVSDVLKMSDINIQSQLDSPFLITSSGAEIAKTINRITKAEQVDEWIKNINREINSLKSEGVSLDESLAEKRTELKQLNAIPNPSDKISKVKRLLIKRKRLIDKWSDLDNLIVQYQRDFSQLKNLDNDVEQLEHKVGKYGKLDAQIDMIYSDLDMIESFITDSESLAKVGIELDEARERYILLIQRNEECPTCFGPITNTVLKRIMESL